MRLVGWQVYSNFTVLSRRFLKANKSGARPALLGILGLTSPRPNNSCITPPFPFLAAHDSGVWPRLSAILRLTSPRSNSKFTTSSYSFSAAHESGVRPPLSGVLGLTSSRPKRSFTTPSRPPHRSSQEWCPTTIVWYTGADAFPPQQ